MPRLVVSHTGWQPEGGNDATPGAGAGTMHSGGRSRCPRFGKRKASGRCGPVIAGSVNCVAQLFENLWTRFIEN
jgi:hypothetical protein